MLDSKFLDQRNPFLGGSFGLGFWEVLPRSSLHGLFGSPSRPSGGIASLASPTMPRTRRSSRLTGNSRCLLEGMGRRLKADDVVGLGCVLAGFWCVFDWDFWWFLLILELDFWCLCWF